MEVNVRKNVVKEEGAARDRVVPLAGASLLLILLGVPNAPAVGEGAPQQVEWRHYGSDPAGTKYTPLDQIGPDNVGKLRILWHRPGVDPKLLEAELDLNPYANFIATPIMVDGVLYTSNAVGLVEALHPGTGETIWVQEPIYAGFRGLAGLSTRGVAYWRAGKERRIIAVRGEHLVSLDAATGRLDRAFGDGGKVSLRRAGPTGPLPEGGTSGPVIVGDVIVVGGGRADDVTVRKGVASEDIRAYDVRSGRPLWTFHVLPRPGEFGYETWEGDSAKLGGGMGAWTPLTVDEDLGYVYVPTGSPMASFYGGQRPGQNLFANSLVCLDARTGERVWHYQLVHHDLWDYDIASPPVLGEITVNGKRIKAVMQPTKHGFLFVFDRVTGEPVWPIEERPVPVSTTPGERAWPTQPFPTRPAPFERQGVTVADLIDFTPELRDEVLDIVKPYVLGPLFTPPSVAAPGHTQGTLVLPGALGGASWTGAAFDPESGIIYVYSHTHTWVKDLVRPPPLVDSLTMYAHGPPAFAAAAMKFSDISSEQDLMATMSDQPEAGDVYLAYGPDGLPLVKPPYGRITAIDLNTGEHLWMAANGDGPRDHPRLRHLNLPPLGNAGRPAPLLTKTLLFIGEGSSIQVSAPRDAGGPAFRAYDKQTGEVLWTIDLPAGTTGAPMSYLYRGNQYILVAIGDKRRSAEWIALGLP
ncbi:MAG: PQQ-binding-like beta-propeller repeat protein [Rhodospirillaceae bacterium]|nr:PQQ-binding-like beta-propeller repeat protein [Rhodospirillaceae bacterium]